MAQQPNNADSPYYSSNESGVGSVFFGAPVDLLDIHLKNLEGIDKAIGQQKAERNVAKQVAAKLLEYKNPNFDGIYPKDREELRAMGDEVLQSHVKLASMDRSSPEWYKAYQEAENKKQELAQYVASSKSFNKDFTATGGRVVSEKNKDANFWGKNVANANMLSMKDRYGDNYQSPSMWVRDNIPTFREAVSTYLKKTYPDQIKTGKTVTSELGDNGDAIYERQRAQNVTDPQIGEIAKGFRSMPELAKSFNEEWDNLENTSPETVKNLKDKYKDLDPITAEEKAKDDYVSGVLKAGQMTMDSFVFKHLSKKGQEKLIRQRASASAGAGTQKNADFGAALNIADFWNGKPGAENAFLHAPLDKSEYKSLQSVYQNGATNTIFVPSQNKIVSAGYEDGKPYVITTESQDPNSKINGATVDAAGNIVKGNVKNDGKVFFASPRALTYAIYGSRASKVHDAFVLSDAITDDGDYDTQSLAPVSKWANPTTQNKQGKSAEPSWFDKNKQEQPKGKVDLSKFDKSKK